MMKIPFILSKKDKEEQIKTCINGIKTIQIFLDKLYETDIKNSSFGKIIFEYKKEFDNFNSVFDFFNEGKQNTSKNIHLDYITRCELPSDTKRCYTYNNYNEIPKNINKKYFDEDQTYMEQMETEQYKYNPEIIDTEYEIYENYANFENKKDLNINKKEDNIIILNKINLSE